MTVAGAWQDLRSTTAAGAIASAVVYGMTTSASVQVQSAVVLVCGLAVLLRSEVLISGLAGAAPAGTLFAGASSRHARDELDVVGVVATMALLSFLMFGLRHVEVFRRGRGHAGSLVGRAAAGAPWDSPGRTLTGVALRVAMVSLAAATILGLLPLNLMRANAASLVPTAFRALVLLGTAAVLGLTAAAVFAVLTWRRLLPGQARLFARTVVAAELRGAQPVIERVRARRLGRRAGRFWRR